MTSWVLDHLWQSGVVAAMAALLALALPSRPARVRFWVWTTASLKFLVPFALLATLGNHLAWRPPTSLPESQALRVASEPFVTSDGPTAVAAPSTIPVSPWSARPGALGLVWLTGAVTLFAVWLLRWMRIFRIVRSARPGPAISASLPMRWTSARIEPGVFGIFRPVLLLSEGIAERLSPAQLDALIAHEQCHVRRRDNLWALLHMLVEATFWFFPPVWWIGQRLIAERERACDEAVLAEGADAGEYGEAVVQVCRYFVAAPVPCVSGVTGADLKRRMIDIANYAGHRRLGWTAKLAMSALLAVVVVAPVIAGRLYAPWQERSDLPAPKLAFDVASVRARPSESFTSGRSGVFTPSPGRLAANCVTLKGLVTFAYGIDHPYQDVLGGGSLARRSACADGDISFFIEAAMPPATTPAQLHEMMRSLLIERFKLQLHAETRQEKVFALLVAPSGLKLPASDPKDDPSNRGMRPTCPQDDLHCHTLMARSWDFDTLASFIGIFLKCPVMNKTGLTGHFLVTSGHNQWRGDDLENTSLPTLSDLLKSFGLVLRSDIGPVDYLVIDHAEMPSGN